jgi:hypothetical protein
MNWSASGAPVSLVVLLTWSQSRTNITVRQAAMRRLRKIAERAGISQTDYAFVMPHEVEPAG